MNKSNGLKSGTPELTPRSFPEPLETSEARIRNLPDRELYGYGRFDKKNKVYDTIHRKERQVSWPIARLAKAEDPIEVVALCTAFLRRFNVIREQDKAVNRDLLFSGTSASGNIEPGELKYAVLRLLGVSSEDTYALFGYDRHSRPSFSDTFQTILRNEESKRRLYPLQHLKDFPEVAQALKEITDQGKEIPIDNIFKENSMPPLHISQASGNQSELPLIATLSILALALEGKVSIEEYYEDKGTIPFKPAILELVERNRKDKRVRQKPDAKKLG